jgi:hypothetical protein
MERKEGEGEERDGVDEGEEVITHPRTHFGERRVGGNGRVSHSTIPPLIIPLLLVLFLDTTPSNMFCFCFCFFSTLFLWV